VIPDLVTEHRVIVPDLPGHGTSAVEDGPVEAERVIAWLDALIEGTCDTSPVVVGQIIGGAIAARHASRNGDRIAHLVLVDTLGLAPFQPAPEFGSALSEFIAQPTGVTHDRLWERCAFDLDRLQGQMGDAWTDLKAYNLDRALAPELGRTQERLMEQFGLPAIPPEELEQISVPTTLIWGRHDLATPLQVAEAASENYGWPLHVIEGAADDPPLEQPEAFLKALRTALERA
jgi:pimeloyl-ACP methyl ester carboxylesterase